MSSFFAPTLDALSVEAILSSIPQIPSHTTLNQHLSLNPPISKSRLANALSLLTTTVTALPPSAVTLLTLDLLNTINTEKLAGRASEGGQEAKKIKRERKYRNLPDLVKNIIEAINEDIDPVDDPDSAAAISDLTESLKSPSSYIPTLTISPLPAFPATLNAATLPVCTVYLDLPSILLDVLDYEFSSTLYLNHRPTVLATKFMEIVHSHLLETFSTARLNAAESNHGVSIILPANKKGSGAANGCTKAHILLLPRIPERYLLPNSSNNMLRLLPDRTNLKKVPSPCLAVPNAFYNNTLMLLSDQPVAVLANLQLAQPVPDATYNLLSLYFHKTNVLSPSTSPSHSTPLLSPASILAILHHHYTTTNASTQAASTDTAAAAATAFTTLKTILTNITNNMYMSHTLPTKPKVATLNGPSFDAHTAAAHLATTPAELISAWKAVPGPVLLTGDYRTNLLNGVSRESWEGVVVRAQAVLGSGGGDKTSVVETLMGMGGGADDFDLVFRVQKKGRGGGIHGPDCERVVREGLGERVTTVRVWGGEASDEDGEGCLCGVTLNDQFGMHVVTKGPNINDPKEGDFKQLWGSKCEVRKFGDGNVINCVVWNGGKSGRRGDAENVAVEIVTYLCKLHVEADVSRIGKGVGDLVDDDEIDCVKVVNEMVKIGERLESLVKKVAKDVLPLQVDGVNFASKVMRYASYVIPTAHPSLGGQRASAGTSADTTTKREYGYDPMDAVVTFSTSNKWPTDLNGIEGCTVGMMVKLGEGLTKKGCVVETNVDGTMLVGFEGLCYRLIADSNVLLDMLATLPNLTEYESEYKRRLELRDDSLVKHHTFIHGFVTTRIVSSGVLRLMERWLAYWCVESVEWEVVEVIVCHVLHETGAQSIMRGFVSVLRFLADFDFVNSPVVFDPNHHIPEADVPRIRSDFDHFRSTRKELPIYVVTPYCMVSTETVEGVVTTYNPVLGVGIEWVVVNRLKSIAGKCVEKMGKELKFKKAFSGFKVSGFDVVFRIDKGVVVDTSCGSFEGMLDKSEKGTPFLVGHEKRRKGIKGLRKETFKNVKTQVLMNFDPVKDVVAKIKDKFGDKCLVWVNWLCPEIIGITLRPAAKSVVGFATNTCVMAAPVLGEEGEGKVKINVEDFAREVVAMGNGVVSDFKIRE